MGFTLAKDNLKVRYSERERIVFGLIPEDGSSITNQQILEKFYQLSNEEQPYHAEKAMIGVLKNLVDKINQNNEPFVLNRTSRRGPYPIDFWIEAIERKPVKKKR